MNLNSGSNFDNGGVFLVTTDLEITWPVNQPVIFLGKWCLRYSRKHTWTNLDFSLAPYHWDNRAQLAEDYVYINSVYEQLLTELSKKLNEIHGVNYSIRYWRIILGYWLLYFTQIYFDRWQMLQNISQSNSNLTMYRISNNNSITPASDTESFIKQIQESSWNEVIYADIAEKFTDINVITKAKITNQSVREHSIATNANKNLLDSTQRFANLKSLLEYFGKKMIFRGYRVSIHLDYLRRYEYLKLALLLRQIPIMSSRRKIEKFKANSTHRNWNLHIKVDDLFLVAVSSEIPNHLPTCFLEGYSELSEAALINGQMNKPKVIVGDSKFVGDEKWKMWAAYNCEYGTKLIIAQHGGHYGTGAWSSSEMHEIEISDRFLSWGWQKSNEKKVVPAPAVKLLGKKKQESAENGICLQVTMELERQSGLLHSFPIASQLEEYLNDQFSFAFALSRDIQKKLTVRLFPQDFGWDVKQRWDDLAPDFTQDLGRSDIGELMKRTKIYVATYNATTFLESFRKDIPTVIFWNPKHWELSEDAQPYFDLLREASILFDDPFACANHVNLIWDDVPNWWSSLSVQEAVRTFINQYAYVGLKPIREIKKALVVW
jgi:putative transferase (TIGR04331 family)